MPGSSGYKPWVLEGESISKTCSWPSQPSLCICGDNSAWKTLPGDVLWYFLVPPTKPNHSHTLGLKEYQVLDSSYVPQSLTGIRSLLRCHPMREAFADAP